MAGWFDKKGDVEIRWIHIRSEKDWYAARSSSLEKPALVFKHSTRCGISSMALKQFERGWTLSSEDCLLYYLDILAYRAVSNLIAQDVPVVHESPQALLFANNELIHHASHSDIDAQRMQQLIQQLK
jgi:bacillithiol system protein YtxJ